MLVYAQVTDALTIMLKTKLIKFDKILEWHYESDENGFDCKFPFSRYLVRLDALAGPNKLQGKQSVLFLLTKVYYSK